MIYGLSTCIIHLQHPDHQIVASSSRGDRSMQSKNTAPQIIYNIDVALKSRRGVERDLVWCAAIHGYRRVMIGTTRVVDHVAGVQDYIIIGRIINAHVELLRVGGTRFKRGRCFQGERHHYG
ncbi:hypothetical protein AUP44_01895 [Tistrella mobilis]|uniref:Uncharacterized protein n=1 Tax=Tistrella mobilis TaxID=171437 RepID=A0A161R8W4_9PROT|nr:hypothetical protein AUP44_01895 [Tistrella mobilis]